LRKHRPARIHRNFQKNRPDLDCSFDYLNDDKVDAFIKKTLGMTTGQCNPASYNKAHSHEQLFIFSK
jgi:hypothetical protein